jgi:hypothetical protein
MIRVSTDHEFIYSSLDFFFACPRCHAEVRLHNPLIEVSCPCGRAWRLVATAVCDDDDEEAPDDPRE